MAVLTGVQVVKVYSEGVADRLVLYAMRNVTTGDTANLASEFTVIKQAICLGVTTQMAFTAAIAGVVVTVPAGLSADAGWLMVWGASA